MSTQEITEFLRDNPKYREILLRAVESEEKNTQNPHYLGWEWHDVRAYPAQLVKLVIAGVTKVNFKSNSSTTYLLVDRQITEQVLKGVIITKHIYKKVVEKSYIDKHYIQITKSEEGLFPGNDQIIEFDTNDALYMAKIKFCYTEKPSYSMEIHSLGRDKKPGQQDLDDWFEGKKLVVGMKLVIEEIEPKKRYKLWTEP